ncbi:unnamed protein product [Didymodactylos carnosus]|uniref:Uncharacterized protein n=1 Tax=Didymodactylos carnosus TaxID=1234261 RepID=A0A8S2FM36_9BILA|nr:unnamed protein product [Didymodactylos carnosus]CAF4297694.1 unnamed protein product [Didymodactylos carnosus]
MSPLSNWLLGLTLEQQYDSNGAKPHNLTDSLICLNRYCDKRMYADFQLECHLVLSYNTIGADHNDTRLLLMKRKSDKQSTLYRDYLFLLKHCDQSHYYGTTIGTTTLYSPS